MPRPAAPSCHLTLCEELTLNKTDWPTEILVFDGENDKPLFETVAAGPEGALVVVVVDLSVVVVAGATVVVVTGLAVVTGIGTIREILLVDVLAG